MFKFGFDFGGEEETGNTCTTGFVEQNDNVVAAAANVDHSALKVEKIGEYLPIEGGLLKTDCTDTISQVTNVAEVLSGVYEGGMKKWECSDDLMHFLSSCCEEKQEHVKFDFGSLVGCRVLDLGCGHGYPGLLCLKKGAGVVSFQDLNEEVLAKVTVANVLTIAGTQVLVGSEDQKTAETLTDSVVQLIRENARKQVLLDYPQYNEMKKAIEAGDDDECTLDFVAEIEQEIADKDACLRDLSVQLGDISVMPKCHFYSGPWGADLSALMNSACITPGSTQDMLASFTGLSLANDKFPEEEYPVSERQAVIETKHVPTEKLVKLLKIAEHNANYKGGVQELVLHAHPSSIDLLIQLGYDFVSFKAGTAVLVKKLQKSASIPESKYRYDLILSADTIYSTSMIPILVQSIRDTLSRTGSALIAAKRYYFGVGGSTAALKQEVDKFPDMQFEIVKVFQDGNSNIREIVQLTWK